MTRILIAPKKSKLQWDMDRLRLSERRLLARYRRAGVDADRILASHERQMEALKEVRKLFVRASVVHQGRLSPRAVERAAVIIALGGDNHFQFVSHFVGRGAMAGVNSDPVLSEGSLTAFNVQTLSLIADRIQRGRFETEKWTRLQLWLDGKKIGPPALSEIFLGEASRCQMSRHHILLGAQSEMQKCSGLIAASGAGSSGWYDAGCRHLLPLGNRFAKTSKTFRFVAAEPYHGKLSKPSLVQGTIAAGQKLKIRSLNDSRGVAVIDTLLEYPFPEGADAAISIGASLRVVVA
jgi:hypothetical protein